MLTVSRVVIGRQPAGPAQHLLVQQERVGVVDGAGGVPLALRLTDVM